MVTRGVDGLAKLGGMGPQIASLVRHSEDVIKVRTVYCIFWRRQELSFPEKLIL